MREMINDYEYTCHTIITMTNIISYNLNGKCSQGKKMTTSSRNFVQPNTVITPYFSHRSPF